MPSDWNSYYYKCGRCGSRYHGSEGGCGCLEDHLQCAGSSSSRECWVHMDKAVEFGGQTFCAEHLNCEGCEKRQDEGAGLVMSEGDRFCTDCMTLDD